MWASPSPSGPASLLRVSPSWVRVASEMCTGPCTLPRLPAETCVLIHSCIFARSSLRSTVTLNVARPWFGPTPVGLLPAPPPSPPVWAEESCCSIFQPGGPFLHRWSGTRRTSFGGPHLLKPSFPARCFCSQPKLKECWALTSHVSLPCSQPLLDGVCLPAGDQALLMCLSLVIAALGRAG